MGAKYRLAASAMALGSLLLGGCVVAPAHPPYGDPPPPRVEVYGVAPYPGAVWMGGYWVWSGRQYDWQPGRWESHRHSQQWLPAPRWERPFPFWRHRPGHLPRPW